MYFDMFYCNDSNSDAYGIQSWMVVNGCSPAPSTTTMHRRLRKKDRYLAMLDSKTEMEQEEQEEQAHRGRKPGINNKLPRLDPG
jgi:hypothetical protein